MYRIRYTEYAVEDMTAAPGTMIKRIRSAIEERLMVAPDQYGSRLGDELSGLWRLRVGDYRVVYEIEEKEKTVILFTILHRKEVYVEATKRWPRVHAVTKPALRGSSRKPKRKLPKK